MNDAWAAVLCETEAVGVGDAAEATEVVSDLVGYPGELGSGLIRHLDELGALVQLPGAALAHLRRALDEHPRHRARRLLVEGQPLRRPRLLGRRARAGGDRRALGALGLGVGSLPGTGTQGGVGADGLGRRGAGTGLGGAGGALEGESELVEVGEEAGLLHELRVEETGRVSEGHEGRGVLEMWRQEGGREGERHGRLPRLSVVTGGVGVAILLGVGAGRRGAAGHQTSHEEAGVPHPLAGRGTREVEGG